MSDDSAFDQIPDEPVDDDGGAVIGAGGGTGSVTSGVDAPATGDPRVDEVLRGLGQLDGLPIGDHVEVFDRVHRGLQDALANVDQA